MTNWLVAVLSVFHMNLTTILKVEVPRTLQDGAGRYSSANWTPDEAIKLIFREDAPKALRVANCESTMNPQAENRRSRTRGLFQISPVHAKPGGWVEALGYTWDDMFRIVPNVRVAYSLWKEQGWGPWSCGRA